MIPREFRLDAVAARLAAKLDGVRRSHDDASQRHADFIARTDAHLDAVAVRYRELASDLHVDADPERHIAFLRHELPGTFLPRFERAVEAIAAEERDGYGIGSLARPVGRLVLGAAGLVAAWFTIRFLHTPVTIPVAMALLALPGLPEVLRWFALRRYRADVEDLLGDLRRLQIEHDVDAPLLSTLDEPPSRAQGVPSRQPGGRTDRELP